MKTYQRVMPIGKVINRTKEVDFTVKYNPPPPLRVCEINRPEIRYLCVFKLAAAGRETIPRLNVVD